MASTDDVNSTLKNIVTNVGLEAKAAGAISTALLSTNASALLAFAALGTTIASAITAVFPRIGGTFTLANATLTVVTQPATQANAIVSLTATNGTAALTQRTQGLFLSTRTAGASFTLSTQSGSAIGTETFQYILFNPS